MTFFLAQTQSEPLLEPLRREVGAGKTRVAASAAQRIEDDQWDLQQRTAWNLLAEQKDGLEDANAYGEGPGRSFHLFNAEQKTFEKNLDYVLDRNTQLARDNPELRSFGVPTTREEFEDIVTERLQAEYADAKDVLDASDHWGAELTGRMWAGATDKASIMSMFLGAPAGSRVLAAALIEGGVNMGAEAALLPRQYEMAERLGIPDPNPLTQLTMAGLTGGAIGGGVAGALRYAEYLRAGEQAGLEIMQRPADAPSLAFGDTEAPRPAPRPEADAEPFDWTLHLSGNAAIREDTVSGMTPRFRSGLEAMIQSAPPRVRSGLQVYSGYRSPEVQAGIIADNMPKYGLGDRVGAWRADVAAMGPEAAGRKWRALFRSKGLTRMVGMPGGSNHQKGEAADLNWNGKRLDEAPPDVRDWVHANAAQFGLHFPMGHEPWHIEPSGARKPAGSQTFTGVAEAGPGFTVVRLPDGSTQRREGARNWRNNNPGNIEYGPFARAHGAVGSDGRFAVFPTYEAGRDAKVALLFDSDAYRSLTIAQAITRYAPPSENNTGAYIATVARAAGVSPDTPTASLSAAQRTAMLDAMEAHEGFTPGKVNGRQVPGSGRSSGSSAPAGEAPAYTGYTSRGYTSDGQVTAGDGQTVQVEYEVVDLSQLTRASGDLQPRDRSRAASDEQVAEIAARLDPARLMPSPEADRGAPIVGPDGMIESGNGRTMAIERAYERHADRAAAYRQQIETAGFPIPEGVERPVLIGRRTSELSEAERQAFVRGANQSQIARMSSTERAAVDARAIDAETVASFTPGFGLNTPENAAFTRAVLAKIPQAERAGLVDATGRINAEGQLRIKQALFARAYDAPDLLARYTETDAGALKSLMEALELAAPEWAAMRAAVADGRLRPEMDITHFVLDAMRLIALARETATREGGKTAQILDGMLAEIDLLEGAVPPLTVALVRKFMPGGKAARAETIADFLKRYAAEAQKIGSTEASLFEAPGPLDALKAIDRDGFGALTETGRASTPPARPEAEAEAAAPVAEAPAPIPPSDLLPATPRAPEAEATVQELAEAEAEALTALRAEAAAEVEMPDGTTWTVGEVLDDLDADEALATVIELCGLKGVS